MFYFTFERMRSEFRESIRVSAGVFDIESKFYCLVYIVSRLVGIARSGRYGRRVLTWVLPLLGVLWLHLYFDFCVRYF